MVQSEINLDDNFDDTLSKIQKLNWVSPDFVLPGTFNEYLENHPYKSSIFQNIENFSIAEINTNKKISILVNNKLYNNIKIRLNEYISDLQIEGYSISMDTVSGGNPNEIKTWIKNEYKNGTSGVILIGDIPAAWAEV